MSRFREALSAACEWVLHYRETVRRRRVLPACRPGSVRARFPAEAPRQGRDLVELVEDFAAWVPDAMTHWNHPRFFAYFPANNSEPSVVAELLAAAMGAQCMSWQTSPAATEIEESVLRWLQRALRLPESFSGVIQDTASSATLVALLMARERSSDLRYREEGAAAPRAGRLRVYASQEAHSSIDKAVFLAGLGLRNLVRVPTDAAHALRPEELAAAIRADREAGLEPCAVVATIGSTSSTAVDPLAEIARICREEGVFLHVDAAFAGSAALLPERRRLLDGVESADSFVFNPHKWLWTNFDCSAHYLRDRELLLRTCAIDPEYLKTAADPEVVNYRDWGIPLGRRFRALKLWFVLEHFGLDEIERRLRHGLALAEEFAAWIDDSAAFERLAPAPLALVCFRWNPPEQSLPEPELDRANAELLARVNASGEAYLTHTKLGGRYTLRVHTAQERTTREDLQALCALLAREAAARRTGGQ